MKIETIIFICIGIAVALILILATVLITMKRKGSKKIKVDDAFIAELLKCLGGRENLCSAKFTNGRVNFELEDVEKADLNALKELSTTGVFVTNQTVKMLFTYDSGLICKAVMR